MTLPAQLPPDPMQRFRPSPYQQAIFDWLEHGAGNAIVSAVAGSGKTTTLVEASKLLGSKRVFFAAFNKHVVATLRSRLPQEVYCQTIHAIGLGCLRRRFGTRRIEVSEFKYRHYCRQTARRIHDRLQAEYENRLQTIREADELPPAPPPADQIYVQLDALVTFCRSTLTDPSNGYGMAELVAHFAVDCPIPLQRIQPVIRYILDQGLREAEESAVIDFFDMIWLPQMWNLTPGAYDWIFVDEAQDLNAAQLALIRKMRHSDTRMLFVGDPRQAIYGFAGADSESYYRIRELTSATEFPLSICYRCAASIVEKAREIVPGIEVAPEAPPGDVQEIEESEIVTYVRENDLVLCRSTEPLLALCLKLLSRRVRAYIKGKEIGEALVFIIGQIEAVPGFQFGDFIQHLDRYRDEALAKLSEKTDSERQMADVRDQVASIAVCYNSFGVRSVHQLKAEIKTLFDVRAAAVTLSTVHKAKGLENERVFVLEYDSLPLIWDNQKYWQYIQEVNLKYVAVTRARQSLFLVKGED